MQWTRFAKGAPGPDGTPHGFDYGQTYAKDKGGTIVGAVHACDHGNGDGWGATGTLWPVACDDQTMAEAVAERLAAMLVTVRAQLDTYARQYRAKRATTSSGLDFEAVVANIVGIDR